MYPPRMSLEEAKMNYVIAGSAKQHPDEGKRDRSLSEKSLHNL